MSRHTSQLARSLRAHRSPPPERRHRRFARAVPDIPIEEFDEVVAGNLLGQFLGLRGAFRVFREKGGPGWVVVTTSIHGLHGSADLGAYQISKHGLVGLVRAGALFGGPLGIRVNAVAPEIVTTALDENTRADRIQWAATGPLRRAGALR